MATQGLKLEVFTQIDRLWDLYAQLQCWDIVQTEKVSFQCCQIQTPEWNHLHVPKYWLQFQLDTLAT